MQCVLQYIVIKKTPDIKQFIDIYQYTVIILTRVKQDVKRLDLVALMLIPNGNAYVNKTHLCYMAWCNSCILAFNRGSGLCFENKRVYVYTILTIPMSDEIQ